MNPAEFLDMPKVIAGLVGHEAFNVKLVYADKDRTAPYWFSNDTFKSWLFAAKICSSLILICAKFSASILNDLDTSDMLTV